MIDINQIKLKKEGVATLQTFFIFTFSSIENWIRHSYGIVSGIVLFSVVILGNRFGRQGVSYVAAVIPPIAFAFTALFWALIANTFHITKVILEFVGALASVAPWLLIGSIFGWYYFFRFKKKSLPL